MTALQKIGAATFVVSIAVGTCGLIWTLLPPFVAESDADYAKLRLSSMGDNMIWFAMLAITGAALGIALIMVGRERRG